MTQTGDGRTPFVDTKVARRLVPLAHQSLRLVLLPGEQVLGMFACTRLRRSIAMLVVTDQRLITLGDEYRGMPVVDDLLRSEVTDLHVEREKMLSTGVVTARTRHGEVGLGTLTYGRETFNQLERVLALRPSRAMPVIPTPGRGGAWPSGTPQDGPVDGAAPAAGPSAHPLVAHLTALADLHARGALTDEEFVAAKARLLADPDG